MITAKYITTVAENTTVDDKTKAVEKTLTQYLIDTIRSVTGRDVWSFRVKNDYLRDWHGNINGVWIQITRNPPSSVPNLYEFVDFKFYVDGSAPCYLHYAFGRDRGESKMKTFKSDLSNIKQNLPNVFKSLYFDSSKVPNLDKVIDIKKLIK